MLLNTSALTCSWFELCIAQHVWRVKVINCFPWAPSLIVHCSCSLITWVKVLPASARPPPNVPGNARQSLSASESARNRYKRTSWLS